MRLADQARKAAAPPVSSGIRFEDGGQTLTTRPTESKNIDWADELRYWDLDPKDWIVVGIPRLSVWEAQRKGGEIIKMRAWKAQIIPAGAEFGPTPILRQASPVDVTVPPRPDEVDDDGWHTAVIFPDAQRPFEDEAAVDVSLQILDAVEHTYGVDEIIHLGDDLDLPDFGKHRSAPDTLGRINEACQRQYDALAFERAVCPGARIRWLEGNHEARLTNWMVDNAPQLLGLRRPGVDEPEPVLSVPFLCRLDELDVEYIGPYPEGEVWLNDHLRCLHDGGVKGAKGATGAGVLNAGHYSSIYGHIHRKEAVWITRHTKNGPRTFFAGSPGSLCDISGRVPSAKSGINAYGKQGRTKTEDWQQGIYVVRYQTDGPQWFTVEDVNIWAGWGVWRGETFIAREMAA